LLFGFDVGFLGNVLNYGLLLVPLVWCSRRFPYMSSVQRSLLIVGLTTAHIILSWIIYEYIFISGLPMNIFIESSLIKLLFAVFISLFTEAILWHQRFREKLEHVEK